MKVNISGEEIVALLKGLDVRFMIEGVNEPLIVKLSDEPNEIKLPEGYGLDSEVKKLKASCTILRKQRDDAREGLRKSRLREAELSQCRACMKATREWAKGVRELLFGDSCPVADCKITEEIKRLQDKERVDSAASAELTNLRHFFQQVCSSLCLRDVERNRENHRHILNDAKRLIRFARSILEQARSVADKIEAGKDEPEDI